MFNGLDGQCKGRLDGRLFDLHPPAQPDRDPVKIGVGTQMCSVISKPNGPFSFLGEAWLCVATTVERAFAASLFWSETLMYVPEIPRLNQRHCDFSLTFPHLKNAFIHIYTHMYCYWTKWRELIKRHRHPWRSLLFFFEHFQSAGCVLLHLAAQQATAPPPEPAGPDLTLPVAGSAG